jgi:HTH-type transcriptional regulator / antitoxin HipB
MITFNDYLDDRLKKNSKQKKIFWNGYEDFKIGVILKEARRKAGLTQNEIASKLKTTKSVVSRIENHAENIRLSTLKKFAKVLGKDIRIAIF